jgi:hypothetical protein
MSCRMSTTYGTRSSSSREELGYQRTQTEEEAGRPESLSLEIDDCRNLTIANYHGYRVTRSRAPFRRLRIIGRPNPFS